MPVHNLILPASLIVLAIPLIFRKVPPNPLYGFRTSKTLSDAGIWYEANAGAGWDVALAGAAILVLIGLKPSIVILSSMNTGTFLMTVQMPLLGLAVAHRFWRLRRL
jgi:hypothetical protein